MLADHPDLALTIDIKYWVDCILLRLGKERGAMSLWWVLTRVIVVGSRRCAMLLSFHCNRKGPCSLSGVVRATEPPQPLPFLHFIVTCNARRQAVFHGGQSAANPSPKPTLPTLPHPLPGLHQVLTALLTAAVSTSQDSSRPIRTKENCTSQ